LLAGANLSFSSVTETTQGEFADSAAEASPAKKRKANGRVKDIDETTAKRRKDPGTTPF
jgi:hypothetical protein